MLRRVQQQLHPLPLREYLVHVPDFPNALSKRLAARPGHIAAAQPQIDAGTLTFFGITLAEHRDQDEPLAMTGSVMLLKAQSRDEVKRLLKDDAYARGGAWDVEKATIWPFHSG